MFPQLPTVGAGHPLSADDRNRIGSYTRNVTPRSAGGKTAMVKNFAGGSVTTPIRRVQPWVPQFQTFPFWVYDASTAIAAKVGVWFGQVNSVTPTIGGTALDNATPPVLSSLVSGVVYLKVLLNTDGTTASAEIHNAASLPAQTATEAYLTIATITVSGTNVTAINQSVTFSLGHERCGVSFQHFWGI
jgi:hypothetical protein